MTQKQIIFVFGMGRSGTSALTRVLSLCGASLPKTVLLANAGNPTGYWEPLEGIELNDQILFAHGATWYDPTFRLQYEEVLNEAEKRSYISRISSVLNDCLVGSINVIKEPRITALADLWLEAASCSGFAVKFVVPVRHPGEVAASLRARDGMSVELASALWLKYNLLAERASRGMTRTFVEYSNLLNDWQTEVSRISAALSIDFRPSNLLEVENFIHRDCAGTPIRTTRSRSLANHGWDLYIKPSRKPPVIFHWIIAASMRFYLPSPHANELSGLL